MRQPDVFRSATDNTVGTTAPANRARDRAGELVAWKCRSAVSQKSQGGFALVEVLVAAGLLAASLVTLAGLFATATRSNIASRTTTYAAVLALQKVEELRALAWGFDLQGVPISDTTTNTAVSPEQPDGGTGLSPSPGSALNENTPGFVDYVDSFGNTLGTGARAPRDAIYTRRWSIQPLPTNPDNTLIIQVLVTRNVARGAADAGAVSRLPEEARLVTVKTRKAR